MDLDPDGRAPAAPVAAGAQVDGDGELVTAEEEVLTTKAGAVVLTKAVGAVARGTGAAETELLVAGVDAMVGAGAGAGAGANIDVVA